MKGTKKNYRGSENPDARKPEMSVNILTPHPGVSRRDLRAGEPRRTREEGVGLGLSRFTRSPKGAVRRRSRAANRAARDARARNRS